MIVCICRAINEEKIRDALRKGESPDDLRRTLGVGGQCGRCASSVDRIAAEHSHAAHTTHRG